MLLRKLLKVMVYIIMDKKIYKSYNTSKEKAEAQKRLLQYVDAQKYKK